MGAEISARCIDGLPQGATLKSVSLEDGRTIILELDAGPLSGSIDFNPTYERIEPLTHGVKG